MNEVEKPIDFCGFFNRRDHPTYTDRSCANLYDLLTECIWFLILYCTIFFEIFIKCHHCLQGDVRQRSEEASYLRESLSRTKSQLEAEKRLNTAIKQRKTFHMEQENAERASPKRHQCPVEDITGKVETKLSLMFFRYFRGFPFILSDLRSSKVESRYNVFREVGKKVRCDDSTLYPDREFFIISEIRIWEKVRYDDGYVVNRIRCNAPRL